MYTAEPIVITNGAGIIFLLVCCGAVFFMIWFLVSLSREGRNRHSLYRVRMVLKGSDWESVEGLEQAVPEFLMASVRPPVKFPLSETSGLRSLPVLSTSQRRWWRHSARSR